MDRIARSATIATLLIALAASTALAQQKAEYPELPNFHKVSENLYRGAQPRHGGVQRLGELGIKTIVNLRGEDSRTRAEKARAEAAGLRYFNVAMPAWGRPTPDQIAKVFAIIQEPANWPVFIHCQRGADRTGTIVACYRISNDGWSVEQAVSEARQNGFHWMQYWMQDFISDYAQQHDVKRHGFAQGSGAEIVVRDDGLDDRIGSGIRVMELAGRRGQLAVTSFFKRLID